MAILPPLIKIVPFTFAVALAGRISWLAVRDKLALELIVAMPLTVILTAEVTGKVVFEMLKLLNVKAEGDKTWAVVPL